MHQQPRDRRGRYLVSGSTAYIVASREHSTAPPTQHQRQWHLKQQFLSLYSPLPVLAICTSQLVGAAVYHRHHHSLLPPPRSTPFHWLFIVTYNFIWLYYSKQPSKNCTNYLSLCRAHLKTSFCSRGSWRTQQPWRWSFFFKESQWVKTFPSDYELRTSLCLNFLYTQCNHNNVISNHWFGGVMRVLHENRQLIGKAKTH